MLSDNNFRNFLLEKEKNVELVQLLADVLISKVIKPQRLILDAEDYYIAIDMLTNTYYICYQHLLMIDIDFYKYKIEEKEVLNKIELYANEKGLCFQIYKSQNGMHAFLVNKYCNYQDKEVIQIMLDLGCDFYYIVYSYLRGWSVRLNQKKKDTSTQLYQYIKKVGSAKEDDYLMKLTSLHNNLVKVFENVEPCLMFGGQ